MEVQQQITVFGANGRIGRRIVADLQARNIKVVAAIHSNHSFTESETLSVIRTDIYDTDSVAEAIHGSTIVISALGSWGTKRKDVLTVGMTHIIPAMQQQSIARLISLTGAESRARGDTLGVVHRLMHFALHVMAPKILHDGEKHIELLAASNLDWTVVRSPIMSDKVSIGKGVRTLNRPYPWQLISRDYVVSAIVDCAIEGSWSKQAPFIV